MQPIALTIIGDIFVVEERARMQGIFGAVWGIAGLVGPLLGGLIVATLSWRWIFYVNVPFGVASATVLSRALVEDVERRPHRLDVEGAGLLSLGVVALLLGVDGTLATLLLPASALLLGLFVLVERRAVEPLVPLRLFASRALATSSALSALTGAAMIGFITFIPLYAQGVLGASPTEAGSAIAPMAIGWPVASAISGRLITRFGFRANVRLGMACVAASGVALALLLDRGVSAGGLRVVATTFGVGMGFANTALVIAVQTSVGFSQRGVTTASTMFFRNIGGTIGVGFMGVVLARALVASRVVGDSEGGAVVARILGPERRTLPAETIARLSGGLSGGLSSVAWTIAGLAVAAALAAWAFPRIDAEQT